MFFTELETANVLEALSGRSGLRLKVPEGPKSDSFFCGPAHICKTKTRPADEYSELEDNEQTCLFSINHAPVIAHEILDPVPSFTSSAVWNINLFS